MPTFCAMMPERMALSSSGRIQEKRRPVIVPLELDLDVDAGGKVELHQSVDRLRRRIDDIEHPLMRANLELLARFLVDMRRAVDGELLDPGRQRNRAAHPGARTLGGRHDLLRRRVEHAVIERFQTDADILRIHGSIPWPARTGTVPRPPLAVASFHSLIETTTPEPTVRPPSRMAKRSFSSIAIGTMRATSIVTLSPGMTISVPAGSVTMPVTSVVRK